DAVGERVTAWRRAALFGEQHEPDPVARDAIPAIELDIDDVAVGTRAPDPARAAAALEVRAAVLAHGGPRVRVAERAPGRVRDAPALEEPARHHLVVLVLAGVEVEKVSVDPGEDVKAVGQARGHGADAFAAEEAVVRAHCGERDVLTAQVDLHDVDAPRSFLTHVLQVDDAGRDGIDGRRPLGTDGAGKAEREAEYERVEGDHRLRLHGVLRVVGGYLARGDGVCVPMRGRCHRGALDACGHACAGSMKYRVTQRIAVEAAWPRPQSEASARSRETSPSSPRSQRSASIAPAAFAVPLRQGGHLPHDS